MTEPCPSCGLLDRVQHVPAAYHGGHSFYRGQGPSVAVPAGDAVIVTKSQVSGVSVTAVARALDPFPPPRRGGGLLAAAIVLAMVGSCFLVLPFSASDDPPPGGAAAKALGVALFSLPSVCVYVAAGVLVWLYVRRVRAHRRQRRGVPAARQVWEQGWFCHRCGGVYFAEAGRLLTPAHFRQLVARAGGYDR
ncbi:hypothetical protein AMES_4821 [Amycolatopsis mediterranei S699]|uniref:Uncharacterized protein n=2 Tax=Amycolatopsis mediterranei TaxID=33910 RepID=A0A0H3D6L1_AMYMU|nr:hypothetical protein [Amycolatopsis mediterranei]ADJ46645.1 hypothetical protein AMED_4879 [Amycolatopsis mediterranei U32]AEK43445.1 hypothetical protein RAM_24835 [Amycolatopsis mediterranei S699]AFO78357.1 hypothetical protein AMES_4821 [Amycolatopsis mediterranei S699]AGT85485.1 hypothetical protein B737_4821 [Amycolatopsis mediterranei RB]KDO11453.1 hypothetical protein DV26_07885 [Amycolatopsis mediterranei]